MKFLFGLSICFFFLVICACSQSKKEHKESVQIDYSQASATEEWSPVPPEVEITEIHRAPSDAFILFDGTNLDMWQKPQFLSEEEAIKGVESMVNTLDPNYIHKKADWDVIEGYLIVKPGTGALETKKAFGDIQLHIEWMTPEDEGKSGQSYSNSGIFLMGLYELQVLNSFDNKTYSNGQAGSVYKQYMPLVNASRPPGEWQDYDIIFKAPRFNVDKSLKSPAKITAFHNGVLIHHAQELQGPTVFIGKSKYIYHPNKLPLRLQDHGDRVQFRNIWIREL